MAAPLPTVWLARHGETTWSLSGQHTSVTDLPLTPNGERMAAKLGERLRSHTFAWVLSSPRQRARRTGALAGFGAQLQVDPDLAEWNYGDYEGKRTAEIRQSRPDWQLFRDGCPGGESPAQIGERADRVLARLRALDGDVLLFAHGHILRVLGARWLGLPVSAGMLLYLGTASLSILGYEHTRDEPCLRLWNDTSHGGEW
jgi:broad specificity phosphatase PhoE